MSHACHNVIGDRQIQWKLGLYRNGIALEWSMIDDYFQW